MVTTRKKYDFHDQIGFLLRRAYQRHVSLFQDAIPDNNLTAGQFVTLCVLREKEACSLNDIVKATAIDQATIRGVIDRLKSRALVAVDHDPGDARKLLVKPTPAGLALIKETVPFAEDVSERTYGTLNAGERVALEFLLKKMIGGGSDSV